MTTGMGCMYEKGEEIRRGKCGRKGKRGELTGQKDNKSVSKNGISSTFLRFEDLQRETSTNYKFCGTLLNFFASGSNILMIICDISN
jgi:hypothetical protein